MIMQMLDLVSEREMERSHKIGMEVGKVCRRISSSNKFKNRAEQACSVGSQYSASRSVRENKVVIHTAFSMTSLFKISSRMNDDKKEVVESIGFGNLIRIPDFKMFPRQIVLWLLSNLDYMNGAIKLRNGDLLPFSATDVSIVLGISSQGRCVLGEEEGSEDAMRRKSSVLMLRSGEEPTVRILENILLKDLGRVMTLKEKEQFKLAFVLYVEAVFLAAKGKNPKVNIELLKKCSDTSIITQLNWADYILTCLKDSAKKVQLSLLNGKQNITIEGCLFFLLVSYICLFLVKFFLQKLNNLDFGLCRCSTWTILTLVH
jgi:hypothetical protein